MGQFRADCGGFIVAGCPVYAVRAVLEIGGRCCTVVRVASRDGFPGARMANTLFSSVGRPGRQIEASTPGVWVNQVISSNDRDAPGSDNRVIFGNESGLSAIESITGFDRVRMVGCHNIGWFHWWMALQGVDRTTASLRDTATPPIGHPADTC